MMLKLWSGSVTHSAIRQCKARQLLAQSLCHLAQLGKEQTNVRGNHNLPLKIVPSRQDQLNALKGEEFDVLVIGGGAVGCGCAVDSACRGLKTALVEADDFGSGASSRSSKLVDGSGSYLGTALRDKDFEQLYIMLRMMSERATMLKIAPHLNRVQPMVIPMYSVLGMPFTWLALKVYDFISAASNVRGSHCISKESMLYEFPLLKTKGLRGGIVYYDVQLDDARMCMALVMTAVALGASVGNHLKLVEMLPQGGCCRVVGVNDSLTGETFYIQAKAVINATGAGTDAVRQLDEEGTPPILVPTVDTYVSVPRYFGSGRYGLLSPSQKKGDPTVVMVPFENHIVLGVHEEDGGSISQSPAADPEDVSSLLDAAKEKMEPCVELGPCHVLSAWTGLRPKVGCPRDKKEDKEDDDKLPPPVSSYMIEVSQNGLITLGGGRFSSYRVMAAEAVDLAIQTCGLCDDHVTSSWTEHLPLDGAQNWCCMLPLEFVQDYDVPMDVAQHISDSYGYNGHALLNQGQDMLKRLHPNFPYIEAEVKYAVRSEYACSLVDVVARRLRVAFVDAVATLHMMPKVLKIMAAEIGWDEGEQKKQMAAAQEFLVRQMGLGGIVRPKMLGKSQPKTKASSQGCCRAAARKEARSYSRAFAPVTAIHEEPLVPSRTGRSSNESAKMSKISGVFTTGITQRSVVDSPLTASGNQPRFIPSDWSDEKRHLIQTVWRNKFMC
ncbi:probable glycerol-3-phosphate dehydrogenase, mitochondrial [Drosophila kikkawai]|uniref:Glycerol-3-phosphate dehydrogenase n=1 Tax=Drosophila kikkawai TaxID=30033 RepID=A0A6P4JRP6_DROKI|nr:probable glycerol-3-phosphate dehydrogenase, mitochondrial [Drosophila kikkawai]